MIEETGAPFSGKPWLYQVEAGVRWWERMRLVYNGILLSFGVLLLPLIGAISLLFQIETAFMVLCFGLAANLAYCLGPGVDAYLTIFSKGRVNVKSFRVALFVLGVIFSIMVMFVGAFLVLGSMGFGEDW